MLSVKKWLVRMTFIHSHEKFQPLHNNIVELGVRKSVFGKLLLGFVIEGGSQQIPGGLLITCQCSSLGLEEFFPDTPESLNRVPVLFYTAAKLSSNLPQSGVEPSGDVTVDGFTDVSAEHILLQQNGLRGLLTELR